MPQVGGGAALEEDEIELLEPGEEPVSEEGAEAPPDDAEDAELSDEDRARTMGWKPLAEYRGDPKRWRPAAEFIRIAEAEAPVMRDQNRRLQEKVVRLEGQLTTVAGQLSELRNTAVEQVAALREMRELAKKADERGYQRAREELVGQRRQAIADGDPTAVEQISDQIAELDQARATTVSPPPPPPPADQPKVAPEVAAFVARPEVASWWMTDEGLRGAMLDCHRIVMRKHPTMPLAEQLEHAFARLKAEYPERFPAEEEDEDPMAQPTPAAPARRVAASPVSRPTQGPARIGRPQSRWEQITDPAERADARAQFQRQQNVDPDLGEDEFLDIYLDPHADVLKIQAKRRKK